MLKLIRTLYFYDNEGIFIHMGQFLQDGIFGPRTSKIWSSSRTAADYKIDLPNIFLASLICISTMFLRKIDDQLFEGHFYDFYGT